MMTRSEMNKRYRLYDNLWKTIDRYTLVDMKDYREAHIYPINIRLYAWLWFSENLSSYCEHCEVRVGRHLGKRLDVFDFPNIKNIIDNIF